MNPARPPISAFLLHWPALLPAVLFPLFYLLNLQQHFHGILQTAALVKQYGIWLCVLLGLQLFIFWLLKKPYAAALLTIFVTQVYFYAYPIAVFFKKKTAFVALQSFSLLVPLWLLLTLFLYFFFRKVKKDVPTAGRWLLTTLLVLSAYEGLRLVLLFYGNHERIFDRDYRPANPLQGSITTTIGKQPDIFFLVYDGFTSSKVLREEFGYDNHPLDSFLEANSFRVVKNGRSNYFDTPVSLASTLNMGYLPQVTPTTGHEELILLSGLKNIHNNHLFRFLEKRGYRIINLSIFPYNNLASPLQQRYMGSRDRDILVMRTLENTSVWPLLNRIFTREKRINYDLTAQQLLEDLDLIDRATIPGQIIPGTQPRFFFIHTLLPHPPYVFERNGNVRNTIIYDRSNRQAYLEQLIYTSERIRQQVRQIREQNPQAIIILQGDHGFRHFPGPENKRLAFGMLHAVSIPQREYGVPHDSVSAVNTFRIILNTCFDQQLPLLPDTTIYPLQQITW